MKRILQGILSLFCTVGFARGVEPSSISSEALQQWHVELSDLRHAIHALQTDVALLEEKVGTVSLQDTTISFKDQLSTLQKKIQSLEKMQEKIVIDLKQIASHASEFTQVLTTYREQLVRMEDHVTQHQKRLEEVSKLKQTLTSLSQAMRSSQTQNTLPKKGCSENHYKVRPKDTLEKIARAHSVSVEEIKRWNAMTNDTIFVDQELKLAP